MKSTRFTMDTLILAIGTAPSPSHDRQSIDMVKLVAFLRDTKIVGQIVAIDTMWDATKIEELKKNLNLLQEEQEEEQRPEFDDPNLGLELEGGAGDSSRPPSIPDFRLVEREGRYFIGPNPIEFRTETLESSYFPNRGDQEVTIQETIVERFTTLRDLGNTCPPRTDAWRTLKTEADRYRTLYIYNCAWWDSPQKVKRNGYFEQMCELANIAATHRNASILLNEETKAFFEFPGQVRHGLYVVAMPARLNPRVPRLSGGRRKQKRTRRGLQKRRASRRWKHRS